MIVINVLNYCSFKTDVFHVNRDSQKRPNINITVAKVALSSQSYIYIDLYV